MPIYEYRCQKCEHEFEELVFSKEQKINCPQCNNDGVTKGFSTFGVGASSAEHPCGSGTCDLSGSTPPCATGTACPSCIH